MTNYLENLILRIHRNAYKLCFNSFGQPLNNAGNMGVFCQSEEDFIGFTEIRKQITITSDNPDQKYFELIDPIVFEAEGDIPKVTYTHLYIRRYDPGEPHIGDVDFFVEVTDYQLLKQRILNGEIIEGARIYDRQDLDMIELYDDDNEALAYVSTKEMAERARIKQSEETQL